MSPPLRALALRWMAWAALARAGHDVLFFVGRLVLARLLWPEAFGLFALASAIAEAFRLCSQPPLTVPLVQRTTVSADLRATAYWSLAALGGLGALLLALLAGPLGVLVAQSGVTPLLRALSVHLLLAGFAVVPRTWLSRELGFRQLARLRLVAEAGGTTAAIVAAVAGAGVYSFVVHLITADLLELIVLRVILPWQPHRHWSCRELLDLWRVAWPLLGRHGVDYLVVQGDRLLVGYVFGAQALGFYSLALRLGTSAVHSIGGVFESVAFPAFARARDDTLQTQRGFLEALRFQAALSFPLVVGLALTAPELVPLVLGPKWTGAVPLVQILAARVLIASLLMLPCAVLLARERQWLLFALSLAALGIFWVGWLGGMPWGPAGVAVGGVVAAALLVPLALSMLQSEVRIRLVDWARALFPAATAAVVMALGLSVASRLMGETPSSRPLRAGLLLLVGALCYLVPLIPWLGKDARRYLALSRADGVDAP